MILVGFAMLIPTVFVARATLAYFGGVTMCFTPLGIVQDDARIAGALQFAKDDHFRSWIRNYGGPGIGERIDLLRPESCCTVEHGGWPGEMKITFWRVLWGGPTHVVQLDALGVQPHHLRPPRVGTDVCGGVPMYSI